MTTASRHSLFKAVNESSTVLVADETLYETADRSELVAEGDPRAAYLFCIPGQTIRPQDAERHGLTKPDEPVKQKHPEADKQAKPGGDK